ncbi:MAG: O-antigen ligase family protein [Patescibacteria group bacterium]
MDMERMPEAGRDLTTLTWGVFLLLVLAVVGVSIGPPMPLVLVAGFIFALLFAFRYIYFSFYVAVALVPFLGAMVAVPTGGLLIGQPAFGGSVDVFLVEIAMFVVIAAWALRLILYWWGRHDTNWRPNLPLFKQYLVLFFAHVISMFSGALPDKTFTLQYSLRPVLFDYVAFVALPVNLIRSRRRLMATLGVTVSVGMAAALSGFVAVLMPPDSSLIFGRAYPLPIFGVSLLGQNFNELAEVMVYSTLFAWALAVLAKNPRLKRIFAAVAIFQFAIGILTFTRTFWIVSILQFAFLCLTDWRRTFKRYVPRFMLAGILLLPFVIGVLIYAGSHTAQSSNDARLMLSEISWLYFKDNPIVGSGAGSFISRVGATEVFSREFGSPLDSHGFMQKLAFETGLVGLLAFFILAASYVMKIREAGRWMEQNQAAKAFWLIVAGAGGAFTYQLFNTDYWTGKMWLPIGIALAASYVLRSDSKARTVEAGRTAQATSSDEVAHDILGE